MREVVGSEITSDVPSQLRNVKDGHGQGVNALRKKMEDQRVRATKQKAKQGATCADDCD